MSFFIGNQDKFLTNPSVHSINTRNKHHLHRPIANLSCFQKGASYSGIRIFNNLPQSITSLRNEKPQFKVALKIFLYAHSFYSVDGFFCMYRWCLLLTVQMMCIANCTDDVYCWLMWLCKFSHCSNFTCLVCFWMFLTCSTPYCLVTASGTYGMYIYFYFILFYFILFYFINSMLHYRASVILHAWLGHLHRNWKLI